MDGQVVVITGASRGIGAAAARVFAATGAKVALLARSGDAIAALARDLGPRALAVPVDVAEWDQMQDALARVTATLGPVDVMINNAGVIEPIAMLADSNPAGWAQAVAINLNGVYHGLRAVLPGMVARGRGTVLTVSSGAAHNPIEGWSHYCASKAAAAMLTSCAHHETAARGLRIMGLSPGTVATRMQREIKSSGIGPVARLEWDAHIPADWPARALLWMCSADADEFLGRELSLRDPVVRARVGLA